MGQIVSLLFYKDGCDIKYPRKVDCPVGWGYRIHWLLLSKFMFLLSFQYIYFE